MALLSGRSGSKAIARVAGPALTIVAGVVSFFMGMGGFFVANNMKTLLEFILMVLAVLAMLSVLPLGIVAVFRPRFAGYALAAAWLVLMVSACVSVLYYEHVRWGEILRSAPVSELLQPLLWYLVLPAGIIALLLYGSHIEPNAPVQTNLETGDLRVGGAAANSLMSRAITKFGIAAGLANRRRQALWAGVILGVLAGAWQIRLGLSLAQRFAGAHLWIGVVGVAASSVALLPLTILGIWKPRLAGYLLALSFVAALGYPLLSSHGLGDVFAYLLWASAPALPLALVATLFLFASFDPNQRAGASTKQAASSV